MFKILKGNSLIIILIVLAYLNQTNDINTILTIVRVIVIGAFSIVILFLSLFFVIWYKMKEKITIEKIIYINNIYKYYNKIKKNFVFKQINVMILLLGLAYTNEYVVFIMCAIVNVLMIISMICIIQFYDFRDKILTQEKL